jgi:anti-sigma regulatory factor (Ser/Thr protein kinase)
VGRLADRSWLDQDPDSGVVVVVGRHRLASDVVSELMDHLASADVRIVACDLNQMAVPPGPLGQVFAPVASYLAAWPGIVLVVCVPEVLQHAQVLPSTIEQRLLVHRSLEAGVREARQLTEPLEQSQTHLAPVPAAAAKARDFATGALRDWHMADLSWPVRLVTSELVTNALQHSASVVDLTVSHVNTRVRIAVRDHGGGAPAIPHIPEAEAAAQPSGRGLQLIQAVTRAWGVFPTRVSGKTVWALLDVA